MADERCNSLDGFVSLIGHETFRVSAVLKIESSYALSRRFFP